MKIVILGFIIFSLLLGLVIINASGSKFKDQDYEDREQMDYLSRKHSAQYKYNKEKFK